MLIPRIPFRLEREMRRPLLNSLPELLDYDCSGFVLEQVEATVGSVRPDILVGVWEDEPEVQTRRNLTLIESHILHLLEKSGPQTQEEIQKSLYLSDPAACRALTSLERASSIDSSHHEYEIAEPFRVTKPRIVAVELKLEDWREAIQQAENYLSFADESYVVLDGGRDLERGQIESSARQHQVGLIWMHRQVPTTSRRAPTQSVLSLDRVLAVNRLCHT